MPRNLTTGVFTRVANTFSNPVYGTVIDPADADALFDDYDTGLTFNDTSPLILLGSTSGILTQLAPDIAGTSVITWPAGTTDFSATGGTGQFVRQDSAGAPFTVSTVPASSISSGDALTRVDDTNVTMTLGGSPSTALLAATSLTMGWSGQLSLARGGTNANLTASNGGIFYSTATAGAVLAGTATARQMLQSGASGAPAWSTTTWPATTTINRLLYSSAANVISDLATANGGVLNTNSTGVPSVTTTPVIGVAGTTTGTIGLAGVTSGTVTITPQSTAGTATFTLPNTSGTPAISVPSPLSLSATSGAVTWSGLTSGGLLYASSTTGVASSALLAANQIVLGGGAGTAPATTANATISGGALTLGQAGTVAGSAVFSGATSGTATIRVAAAAGTGTIFQLPPNNGTSGYILSTDGSGNTSWITAGSASSVTVGSTAVNSGTTARVLYDNAGVLGEYSSVPVAVGGTGTTTLTNHGVLLGQGTSAVAATSVGSTGQVLSGVTGSDPTFQTAGFRLLNTLTASSSATLDDTTSLTSTYDNYLFVLENIFPATDGAILQMRVTQDGGSNWLATGYINNGGSGATTYLTIAGEQLIGNGTSIAGYSGNVWVSGINRTNNRKMFFALGSVLNQAGVAVLPSNASFYNGNNSAINGVRFLMSTGNISSGIVRLYGMRTS